MASARAWIDAARPRTLPAAIVPVLVGVGVARAEGAVSAWRAVLALLVSLFIQIGTNYANDYSDGVRGTDAGRVGPLRLVASGTVSAPVVRRAAVITFALAAGIGLVLAITTSPWLIVLGAASIAAGWLYTGGPKPYGYLGLGEVFVFLFFGPVAVLGTTYVCALRLSGLAVLSSVPVGLFAVSLLVVNNLRDIPTDALTGKRTLAVMIGERATRRLYVALLSMAFLAVAGIGFERHFAFIALVAVLATLVPVRLVVARAEGRALIAALSATGRAQLVFGILLAIGIAL